MKGPYYGLATLAVWALVTALLLRRFRGIFDLEPEDQKLMYYSESAFYLSFYNDVVEAPDWRTVWRNLIYDDRTEFPTTIISFRRLNIIQEILLGAIYRFLNSISTSINSFNFYAISVMILNGGGVALLFLLSCKTGKSIWSGVLFFGLYLSNFQEKLISRIAAIPLRENFALTGLWASLLCIRELLGNRKDDMKHFRRLLFLSFTWMFLTWQLSLHIVGTQLVCLFILNILGAISDTKMWKITTMALYALIAAWFIMLCPPFLITSHLLVGIVALLITLMALPAEENGKVSFGDTIQRLLLACSIFCLEEGLLSLTARHDGHISDMFLSKLGITKPTFDSQIYLLGTEFRPLSIMVIRRIVPTRLFHYVGIAFVVMLFLTWKRYRPLSGFRGEFNSYFLLQAIAFCFMAMLVSRLRVLALPLLCVFAGYLMQIFRLGRWRYSRIATILAASIAIAPYWNTLPVSEIRAPPFGELYNNRELKDLITWVNRFVEPGTPLLSDMPTSSALRAATKMRTVINPQYEHVSLRRKTHFFYTLGDCNDARWFGEKMREWYHTEIVVVPTKFCAIPHTGGPYGVQLLLSLNPLGTCPPNTSYARRLCNRLWAGDPHFEQLFSNERYLVFRYKGIIASDGDISWKVMHQLDHYKPWIHKYAILDNELGPRQIASTAHALKAHFNSPVVFPLLSYGLKAFDNNNLMLRLYAETMDFDLGMFEDAKRHYNILFKRMKSRCESLEDFDVYSVYLSHMLETGSGEATEILDVIEASSNCLNLKFPRTYGNALCEYSVTVLKAFNDTFDSNRAAVRNLAARFFLQSQAINYQNPCFFKNYTMFNAVDLSTLDVLIMFLTNN
ncbi:hypothetical protein BBOV_II005590 [Babesia bovis T2Bo]|uniref:hypothetical protein n=1 Tax=Babesia bovis T2Bo TaxID=484906 RepID=UPI001C357D08|nr:hypothetical protein BBOV_II005590 [Babesia bovis T2Bo]EDO06510.2 hypothetical protein BBOV_II005590 [Babesia bovis T2Bo]